MDIKNSLNRSNIGGNYYFLLIASIILWQWLCAWSTILEWKYFDYFICKQFP